MHTRKPIAAAISDTVRVEHGGKLGHRTAQIAPQEQRRLVFEWLA